METGWKEWSFTLTLMNTPELVDVEFGLDKNARFASTLEHYQEIV